MLERITGILEANGFSYRPVTYSTELIADLKLNSLNVIELISDLEDEFDVEIPDKSIKNLKNIGNVVQLIISLS